MEVWIAIVGCFLAFILLQMGLLVAKQRKDDPVEPDFSDEIKEVKRCSRQLQESVERMLYKIEATGKLSESQHYENRQVLSLLGQQIQNQSAAIHQLSVAFSNRVPTINNNVQTGDRADNENTQAGQIND